MRGMRIRVTDVLALLANHLTFEQILEEMPDLEEEDIQACVEYAIKKIDYPEMCIRDRCQTLRKATVQMIEVSDAMISGSSGAVTGELAEKNCAMAKEPPLTKHAGQTSQPFFHPDMTTTR